MIFVLDIGNTNTVMGVFEKNELKHEWRIKTDRHKTEDEFAILIKSLFDFKNIKFSDITGIIISSVVPPIMQALERMCINYFDKKALIVGESNVRSRLNMKYPNPKEIGADRIVNAIGAIEEYEVPFIIIDFGTATTYCYIDDEQAYCGGVISPGIKISMDALYEQASKLPKIQIEKPDSVVGNSTVGAMQSGVYYGYIGQVDGIVKRIKAENNPKAKVIATGGFASLIAKGSETIDYVDTHLTLKGLHLIYETNIKEKEGN